ncbi:capsular polysaccharide export protein, LipB/KpsS family [Marimonas arenosa]|uniref:Capsule polysaccharide biosynthesis protein n=1 Tax=Marimonas arenosa TaxID=1795305 RepID=A0AAE3WES2_9RHOB|nr:hypothetical protein [Marimonas arenosa]MDQ2090355.1 hypothetical protein [Marimonas arenosa]
MIRLLCDARGDYRRNFLDQLLAQGGGDIKLGLHFGYKDADYHGPALQWMNPTPGKRGTLMQNTRQTGANMSLIASEEYGQILETAVEQLHRTSPHFAYRAHNIRHVQDYLDYFHILTDAMAQQILAEDITHALFFNVPHLFYDTLLYEVARALGVKTTVLSWSQFPGRFFSMNRVQDLGRFDPAETQAPPYEIERGTAPELFYMDDKWQQPGETGKLSWKAVARMVKFLALRDPLKLANPAYVTRTLRRMQSIYGTLPDWRDPFAKFFHTNELAYFEYLSRYENQDVDLSGNYIYVPLHNQPEMSTSALGGKYRDQALVIETLARNLPEGWQIFVKENPRQGAYARGPMFFHRLERIPSVRILPSNASTHALAANARFVASVTGTVGWEAIRVGRPAMVFGAAWYGSFPGVVHYRDGLDFEEIAAMEIDHDALEQAAGALYARTHEGLIEQLFFPMTPDLDHDKNAAQVGKTSLGLLKGDIPVTFGIDS